MASMTSFEIFGFVIATWQFFAGVGMLLIGLEVLFTNFQLFPIGLAFLLTAFVTYFIDLSLSFQIILLALFVLIHFYVFKRWIQPKLKENTVMTGVDSMIGKEAIVTEVIRNDENRGYVQLYGDFWRALSVKSETIEVGATVIIQSVDGNKVWVVRKE